MAQYDFIFGSNCAGIDVEITDTAGDEVDGSPLTLNSQGAGQLTLSEGIYVARTLTATSDGGNDIRNLGVLNVAASIEQAELLPEAL